MVSQLMPFTVVSCGLTDVGLVRSHNEDCWSDLPGKDFFVLADGMGGHQGGEVASNLAVTELCRLFEEVLKSDDGFSGGPDEIAIILSVLYQQVNDLIVRKGFVDEQLYGMGTTLETAYFIGDVMVYGHVGDSRIYRYRQGKLEQLTTDHSLFREMLDLGELDENDCEEFLYKNVITKAIGMVDTVDPSTGIVDVAADDIFLMCTDGLTDLVAVADIEEILTDLTPDGGAAVQDVASSLVNVSKECGGRDNVTVVVIQVRENG